MGRLPLIMLTLFWPAIAFGAGELARSQSELESLSARIEGLMAEIARDNSTADNITEDLDRLDQNKAVLNRRIRQNEQEVVALDETLFRLKTEADQLSLELAAAEESLTGLIRSRYMLRDTNPLRVLLDQQDPQAAARRLTMFRYLVESGNRELLNLERLVDSVQRNRADSLTHQKALAVVKDSLDRDRKSLAQEETEYRQRLASVRQKLTQSEQQITIYREREIALEQLIAELSKPPPRSREPDAASGDNSQQEPQAELASAPQSGASRVAKKSQPRRLTGGFSKQKGRLSLPLASPLSARFGDRRADSGLKWEGLLFESREGEPVHAIFPGQVVFSDWFRGYGQLMVVDHGEGFMSLYGHNRELGATVGELVDAGQVIAKAAAAGQPPVPGVYFEIRHNGAPDDPLKWCR